MFYRDQDGRVLFKPLVEINPRYTMGRVVVELGRFNRAGTGATLRIGKDAEEGEVRLTPEGGSFGAFVGFPGKLNH